MKSGNGVVLGFFNEHVMEPSVGCRYWPYSLDAYGYGQLRWQDTRRLVHAVTCELWHGPRPDGLFAIHSCHRGHLGCWAGEHLSWGTPQKNQQDRVLAGTSNRGERYGLSKLTETNVLAIRARYAAGGITQKTLAAEFGVGRENISAIILRKSWAHLCEAAEQATDTTIQGPRHDDVATPDPATA